MDKTLEIGTTALLALLLCVILVQRPAFGTWELEVRGTLDELLEAAEDKALSDDDSDETASAPAPVSTAAPSSSNIQLAGLDVSHYQGNIDWEDLAEAGIKFAYAKATDGITYTDPMWPTNKNAAPAEGILIGGYHFYQPADDPTAQAQSFLAALGGNAGGLPPVVDLEKAPDPSATQQYVDDLKTFLAAISSAMNCQPIIYADLSFYTEYLVSDLADFPLWLAEYRSTPPSADGPAWLFWQHTQNGFINGISGAVDLDLFDGDEQDLSALTC